MRTIILVFLFTSVLQAGTSRLPLAIPEKDSDWSTQSMDQEMAPGVVIDAMFERAKDGTKIVAVSSIIREQSGDRLREFALGIKDSFAQHGVRDLREQKRSIAGVSGLVLTFVLKQGEAEIPAALFVLESGERFFAYISFGGTAGTSALESLQKKKTA
jgi:hypothetical protein